MIAQQAAAVKKEEVAFVKKLLQLRVSVETFTAWLAEHVRSGIIYTDRECSVGICQFGPPVPRDTRASLPTLRIHGYMEKPDPEMEGASSSQTLENVVTFEMTPLNTGEAIALAECPYPTFLYPFLTEFFEKLLQEIERAGLIEIELPAKKGVGKRRGPTVRTQARAEVFKKLKDAHPEWSQAKVAMEAERELNEDVTVDTVRNAYRAMGWKWERGDRIR